MGLSFAHRGRIREESDITMMRRLIVICARKNAALRLAQRIYIAKNARIIQRMAETDASLPLFIGESRFYAVNTR